MTTVKKLFSYDSEEDADIEQFIESLPQRQHSKYIRMALRLLKQQMKDGGLSKIEREIEIGKKEIKPSNTDNKKDVDDFEDPPDDFFDLGK